MIQSFEEYDQVGILLFFFLFPYCNNIHSAYLAPSDKMNVMSTLIPGAFLAAFLCLVCIVIKRLQINLVWELECYLEERGYKKLVKPIRAVNKAFTPPELKEIELQLIESWNDCRRELQEILQREIYLLEERDALKKQACTSNLSRDEKASLTQIKYDLTQVKPHLWKNSQRFVYVKSHLGIGSWLLEFERLSPEEEWESGQHDCAIRLGCCGRDCGCCERPRKGREGQHPSFDRTDYSHCTVECGCCIRWRGFRHLEKNGRKENN